MLRVAFIGIGSKAIQTRATGLMFLRRETLQMRFNTNSTINQNGNNKPTNSNNHSPWNNSINVYKMVA